MKTTSYDVFVIGSGVAGRTAAMACAEAGLSVAIADNREFGGTCAIRGCDAKKVLIQFADLIQNTNQLKGLGVDKLPKINWQSVQKFKSTFTDPVPRKTENQLQELGIKLYHQSPTFINEKEILVEGKKIIAENYIIATGYVPRELDFPGSEFLDISDDILNLNDIPKTATFIGSGYVGMEFCFMLSTLGCKVTVLELGDSALSTFDPFLVEQLVECLKTNGVEFIFNAETTSVEQLNKNYRITYKCGGKTNTIKARKVYNTSGRIPAIDMLDLGKASIKADGSGVLVNDFMQSISNKNVYACGDVSSKSLPLTPVSGMQGYIVGHNIIHGNEKEFQNPVVPSVVFTYPKLASVGFSETEAKTRFKSVKVYQGDASKWFQAKRENAGAYAYKILVNERTQKIVGAHLLSSQAHESINSLAMAIQNDMTVRDLKKMIFTYPSHTNDLKSMLKDND